MPQVGMQRPGSCRPQLGRGVLPAVGVPIRSGWCRPTAVPGCLRPKIRLEALEGSSQGAPAALNSSPLLSNSLNIGNNGSSSSSGPSPGCSSLPSTTTFQMETSTEAKPQAAAGNQPTSWEAWLQHFEEMDDLAEEAAHLQVELSDAVRQERYQDATRHKKQLEAVRAADAVAAVQKQLQASLEGEQYGAAAQLRDQGLVGVQGWWAGRSGPDDFTGHLMHIKAEFGRWTGRVYTARDIAQMNGWRDQRGVPWTGGSSDLRRAKDSSMVGSGLNNSTVGAPLLEVFVRQAEPGAPAPGTPGASLADGQLVHQAVALRAPAPAKGAGKRAAGAGAATQQQHKQQPMKLNASSVVRFNILLAKDGSARIRVLPPQPIKSKFSSWEEEEMKAAMAALAGDSHARAPSAQGTSAVASTDAPMQPTNVSGRAGRTSADLGLDVGSSLDSDSDMYTDLVRGPAAIAMIGRDRFVLTVPEDGAATSTQGAEAISGPSFSGGAGSFAASLPRWEVAIDEDSDEDVPSVSMPSAAASAAAAAAAGRAAAAAAAAAASGAATASFNVDVEVLAPAPLPSSEGVGAPATSSSGQQQRSQPIMLDPSTLQGQSSGMNTLMDGGRSSPAGADAEDDELGVSLDMLSTGYGTVDAVATSITQAEEQSILIEIPVGRLLRQQETERAASNAEAGSNVGESSSSAARQAKDTFDRLAERVVVLQAKRGAVRPMSREQLAGAIRTLARRLLAGEMVPDGTTLPLDGTTAGACAATSSSSAATRSSASSPSSRSTYFRLHTDAPRTDPLSGLYLGSFGQHGPELISLSRSIMDGEETVTATKVTGDPNVPAGEVSFRAKVGRKHKLSARNAYPDELGIMARYKGEGRVAMPGYKNPRWVEGELLVFAVGASPLTSGAELGFVWSVPGEKRFLILLNKLDLAECER